MTLKSFFATLLVLALGAPLALAGEDHFKLIHTSDLAAILDQGSSSVHVYDANNNDMRKREGIIPGATPLPSHNNYSLSMLPTDKTSKLVFYCANEQCMASHAAAARAANAGYTDVSVLSDGILGWKKNGQKTAKFTGSNQKS